MERKHCWEVKKCGLEPGGENTGERGICPAAIIDEYDGINKGKYAGRFCWTITGTLCNGEVQGIYEDKLMDCLYCEFLKQVNDDEGGNFVLTPPQTAAEL